MSGIRLGAAFGFENKPGEGPTKTNGWLVCPPNFFMTLSFHRSTNRMDAMGTKKFDYIAYGAHYVNWSTTFTADYEMLEPLLGVFEEYTKTEYGFSYVSPNKKRVRFLKLSERNAGDTSSDPYIGTFTHRQSESKSYAATVAKIDGEYRVTAEAINGEPQTIASDARPEIRKIYKHRFEKADTKRVPTMCFRRIQLNKPVQAKHGDEILEIYGAVCTECSLSITAGSSQIQVNQSGFAYLPKKKLKAWLSSTEYVQYDGEHVMFACFFNDHDANANTYVADVQTLRVSIKNNATKILSTCGPKITNYQEGKSEYELTVNVYSEDALFRDRMFTGGQNPESGMANYKVLDVEETGGTHKYYGYLESPLCKGLLPMPEASIVSYDTCRDIEEGLDFGSTIEEADFKFSILADDIVFKQMSLERGDSSKLMDNLTSAECRSIAIEVLSDVRDYSDPADNRYNKNITQDNMIWYQAGNYNTNTKPAPEE